MRTTNFYSVILTSLKDDKQTELWVTDSLSEACHELARWKAVLFGHNPEVVEMLEQEYQLLIKYHITEEQTDACY